MKDTYGLSNYSVQFNGKNNNDKDKLKESQWLARVIQMGGDVKARAICLLTQNYFNFWKF